MKIYTKTGDTGETSLYGGQRVRKNDLRVETYGTIDECNAVLGMAVTQISDEQIKNILLRIQGELFEVGADLATPIQRGEIAPRIRFEETARLESEIDQFEEELPALRNFILPGGSPGGATLHFARVVCRRAERLLVELAGVEEVNPETLRYVNRLGDHLFVLARVLNHRLSGPEHIWVRPTR